MRTTVGPLPPAVYWRRRAVVLGALLLGLIVLFVSCSGDGGDDRRGGQAASPAPAAGSSTPEETPSFADPQPGSEPSLPAPDEVRPSQPAGGPAPSAGADTPPADVNVTAPGGATCTDAEMAVTPVPAATTVRRGQPLQIHLKIRNASARSCTRDVGADPQEIYIERDGRKVWSSDTCGTARGSDPRTFAPGAERDYVVTWNGRTTSACAGGLASGPAPAPGTYQVRGRLGNRAGTAVALTVTA